MVDILEEYIQKLIENQNYGAGEYTVHLKDKEDYYALLQPVYEYYKRERALTRDELYQGLLDDSLIKNKIDNFIERDKMAPGMVLAIGTPHHRQILTVGKQQEIDDNGLSYEIKMQEDSIFDLSSVTKIFTCIVVLQLIKEQIIKIDSKIGQLDKRFKYLEDVTIKDLLSFRVPLRTDDRIENALSYEDAESLILNIKPDYTQSRLYTDMGAIVLSYVVESVTGTDLYNLVRKYILDPCDMKDTVLVIRPEDMGRVVSNNYERRIANNNYCVIRDISKGMVNDGKARKLEKWCPRLYGHAGLFSTAADMGKFASMMLSGDLLDSQFVNKIGVNHTGKKNEDGTFSQFHGLLCYSKNPVAKNSEVNHWLSGNAFALGGYTGNQLTIDYRNQLYIFMASNRCHNRITSVSGMDIVYEAGMTLEWPDGKRYICNKRYAFDRDESVINPAIELAMKWRFLEWLLGSESKGIKF